ncbi:hypothetical protein [Streptomyces vinaceus]
MNQKSRHDRLDSQQLAALAKIGVVGRAVEGARGRGRLPLGSGG